VKLRLLAIAVTSLACAPRPRDVIETMRLPLDLPAPSIVRQAEGSVAGPDGSPIAGALVTVIDLAAYRGIGFSIAGRDGRFSIGLPSTPVVVTATANGHVAGSLVPAGNHQLSLVLARPSAATRRYAGTVRDTAGHPLARVRLRLMRWGWPLGTTFYASSDDAGAFQFLVDKEGSYDLMVDDPRYVSNFAPLLQPTVDHAALTAYAREAILAKATPPDQGALREACIPLTGDGLRLLVGRLRGAVAIGLGEATHGTREFTELRSDLVAALARDRWLTTIAVEASWEEVIGLDDYVRHGKGTGRDVVKALAYWPWRTEEMVAFVESVRRFNDGVPDGEKVEFFGVDYAPPAATLEFVGRSFVGAPEVSKALADLEPVRRLVHWGELSKLSREERDRIVRALEELRLAAEREHPSLASRRITHGLRITQSIVEAYGHEDDFRDPVMAGAVLSLLSRADRERRIAIWAHNLHLAEGAAEGAVPMGHYLRARLADKYRAIGTMFYAGSFRTYSGLQKKMVNHVVALPPPFYLETAMQRASPSTACALDVADATRRPGLRGWIAEPKHVRVYGGQEISESYPWPPVVVPDLYSVLVFVPTTTPTTPLDE
jgi:erythromycin esterase